MKPLFKHLDKVFWPKERFTKGHVIHYYTRIAPVILPYLRNRPMVLARHPNGIRGMSFFQKDVSQLHLPPFVDTISIRARSTGRRVRYIVCNNRSTLLYLANLGCIEMHPWLSQTKRLNRPEMMVIDLDPGRAAFEQVVAVARRIQKIVAAAGGRSFVKTSGKTGLHVCLPLRGKYEYEQVRMVARLLVRRIHAELPRLTTHAQRIANRGGKIYLDFARNSFGQTVVAPYSLRAWPGAAVSTPLAWSDLRSSTRPGQFNIRSVFRRLAHGDIWRGTFQSGLNLNRLERRLRSAEEETKRKKLEKPERRSRPKRLSKGRRHPIKRRLPARRRRTQARRSRSRRRLR